MTTPAGRFAPSPTGDLHLGNLRTALLAWLFARSTGRRFLLRIEDLDRARAGSAAQQLTDLAAIGITWDETPIYQSRRQARYDDILAQLASAGLVYECYCSRKDIDEAAAAPQQQRPGVAPPRAYPGTCRNLTEAQRARRRASGRPAALRLRASASSWTVSELLGDDETGHYTGLVDDVVLRRNDGTIAYNLAVVVDDADQGIDQVVRGDDLLVSAPRQAYLADVLGLSQPTYAHVPLALGPTGRRLAKRDGAVTLTDLAARGITAPQVLAALATSLGLAEPAGPGMGVPAEPITAPTLLARFNPTQLPRAPWTVAVDTLFDLV